MRHSASIGPLGTYFSEILIEILTFSFKKMRLNVSSAKWRPFCLGLSELTVHLGNLSSPLCTCIHYIVLICFPVSKESGDIMVSCQSCLLCVITQKAHDGLFWNLANSLVVMMPQDEWLFKVMDQRSSVTTIQKVMIWGILNIFIL